MKPQKIVDDMRELDVLRKALARCAEYQPGKVTCIVQFNSPIRAHAVRREVEKAAGQVVKACLPTDEMRTQMEAKIAEKIAAIEAKYPAGMVDGGA